MSDDLQALTNWLQPLIAGLQPAARRQLASAIARELRRQTQRTMRAQTAPDGTPWQARRAAIVNAGGQRQRAASAKQRKGPMMAKLRLARNLPISASADQAAVTFAGRVLRIAGVHQFGLPDKVTANGPEHVYAARPMLGISDEMQDKVRALVVQHLQAHATRR